MNEIKNNKILDELALRDFGTIDVPSILRGKARVLARELGVTPREALDLIIEKSLEIDNTRQKKSRKSKNNSSQENKERLADSENNGRNFVKCSLCNQEVLRKNFKKHNRRAHRKTIRKTILIQKEEVQKSRYKPPNRYGISPQSAGELLTVIQETKMISNNEIKDYLDKNTIKDDLGKFGLPQDKYRWGFYGSGSMEYDTWRKSNK